MNTSKFLVFLILTVMLGIVHHAPFLNFQNAMAVGDQGFNLYAFERTAMGERPYVDFWWCYGPFAPYYFAAFIKIFGATMSSVLAGKALLNFLAGLFCFLAVTRISSPILGLTVTVFYWAYYPDFFYSYNHTAGITCFMGVLLALFHYYKDPRRRWIWFGFLCLFILCLVRINMGIALLFGYVVSLIALDRLLPREGARGNLKLYLGGSLAVLGVSLLIYVWMLSPLPWYKVQQCMPYFNKIYMADSDPDPYLKYKIYWSRLVGLVTQAWSFALLGLLLLVTTGRTLFLFFRTRPDKTRQDALHFCIAVTAFLTLLVAHEFLMGAHVYRAVWTIPFQMVFFGLTLHFGTKNIRPLLRETLILGVLAAVLWDLFRYYNRINHQYKVTEQLLHTPKATVYLGNHQPWIRTVEQVSSYLRENLADGETFFAVPYEPLYYFLADRKSPSWHMMFVKGAGITDEQEQEIIRALKDPSIKYVLLSNRYRFTSETRLGELGTTHLIEMSKYINDHFQTEATFGAWEAEAGWNFNHGVKILRRLPPGETNN
ncbi:MAG: hypothetical protein H6756_02770 [Candidatus Omnitrophica bacterium]|nr:hypothetical protein [Candidatus Omnitrophota bacterium]